jgi:ADP-heptose:LPS heptosyltransferase
MSSEHTTVVIAPFANERVRQWPTERFRDLIDLILREQGYRVAVLGTRDHRIVANDLVRSFPSHLVSNTCGNLSWSNVVAAVDAAPYVVANNSGIAHLAGARGKWTLCIFSASHAYNEWMPRGRRVVVIGRDLPCSPCDIGTDYCPNDVRCMTSLPAEEVFFRFRAEYDRGITSTQDLEISGQT